MEKLVLLGVVLSSYTVTELCARPSHHSGLSSLSFALKVGSKAQQLINTQRQTAKIATTAESTNNDENKPRIIPHNPYYYNNVLPFITIYDSSYRPEAPPVSGIPVPGIPGIPPVDVTPLALKKAVNGVSQTIKDNNPRLMKIAKVLTDYLKNNTMCRSDFYYRVFNRNSQKGHICVTIRKFIRVLRQANVGFAKFCTLARPSVVGEIGEIGEIKEIGRIGEIVTH